MAAPGILPNDQRIAQLEARLEAVARRADIEALKTDLQAIVNEVNLARQRDMDELDKQIELVRIENQKFRSEIKGVLNMAKFGIPALMTAIGLVISWLAANGGAPL